MAKLIAEPSKPSLIEKVVPVLLVLSIGLAFMVGVLWQKVTTLEKGGVATTTTEGAAPAAPAVTLEQIKDLFTKNIIKIGDSNRKLLIVEVADSSCPRCHVAGGHDKELYAQMGVAASYVAPVPELKKLVDAGKASFAYIYYPGHGNGEMGTKALYCANEKGKFWQAHDLLMSNAGYNLINNTVKNDKTKSALLADFLKSVVKYNDMKACLDSGKYDNHISDDMALAQQFGFNGTPDFFVNTTNFAGAYSFDDMQSAVDAALK